MGVDVSADGEQFGVEEPGVGGVEYGASGFEATTEFMAAAGGDFGQTTTIKTIFLIKNIKSYK